MSIENTIQELTAAILGLTDAINSGLSRPAATTAAAATTKPKTEKKADPVKEEVKPDPVKEEVKPDPVKEEVKAEVKVEAKSLTYEDVKGKFLALNTKKGRDATIAALKECGVNTVPELQGKPEQFSFFVETAQKHLG